MRCLGEGEGTAVMCVRLRLCGCFTCLLCVGEVLSVLVGCRQRAGSSRALARYTPLCALRIV